MTNLVGEVSPFHPEIRTDMLVYRPSKFIVQLPCKKAHENRRETDDTGNGNKESFEFAPDFAINPWWVMLAQSLNGFFDFVHLHGAVYEKPNIANAESNDLDCVFQA